MEWGHSLYATLCHKQTSSESLATLNMDSKAAWPPHPAQGLGMGEGARISLGAHLCQVSLWVLPECPLPSLVRSL